MLVEKHYRLNPEFTVDWFSGHIPNWEQWLAPIKGKPCRLLEIGCFEGRCTVWLLENVMTNPDSMIWCIDSFKGGTEHKAFDFGAIRRRFDRNTDPWKDKVQLLVEDSKVALDWPYPPLDFVYVDGSHQADDVFQDAVLAWPKVRLGGLMVFDDYEWDGCIPPEVPTKVGIDRFLEIVAGQFEIVHKAYQLAIRKLDNPRIME